MIIAGMYLFKIEALQHRQRKPMPTAGISRSRIAPAKNSQFRKHLLQLQQQPIPGESPLQEPPLLCRELPPVLEQEPHLKRLKHRQPVLQAQAFPKTLSWTDCPMF